MEQKYFISPTLGKLNKNEVLFFKDGMAAGVMRMEKQAKPPTWTKSATIGEVRTDVNNKVKVQVRFVKIFSLSTLIIKCCY